ncbi:MAG: 1-acyl-sn-glycerol-3-phosphate acyltransferase [Nitriliruptorales bacterium]|nr:1-acyl-sn-glycerol-3-phosphate acyltransferase [Nitriliruptorales bacterium]
MGLFRDLEAVARGWRWTRRSLTPQSATPHVPVRAPREFPTAWARTPAAQAAREMIHRFVLKPLVWRETRPRVHGLDRLEELRGPVVFVSNHASHLDAPLLLGSLPLAWRRRLAVGAAADYFFDARWRAALTALAFNAFPVERRGGKRVTTVARQLLADDWSLLLFPEGTRSPDGWVGGFRPGAAVLCCSSMVPAVPVAVRGSFAAMPRGRSWPLAGRPPVVVRYGPPLYPEEGERARAFSERLAHAVARLWDEEEETWFASLRRSADGSTPRPVGPDAPRWRRVWESTRSLPTREPERTWPRD